MQFYHWKKIYIYIYIVRNEGLETSSSKRSLLQNFSSKYHERGRNNNSKQLLTVTPFFFFYFRLIQPYPRLLLSYSHSSSSVESGLSGHSIIWVIRGYRFLPSIEAHQPNILHRNILIAINNCRRDNTTLARIHPSPPPLLSPSSWKNFRINYRADYRTGMEFRHLTSG